MLSQAGRVAANMAQSKVNDYFSSKKKKCDSQAAKRRKIEIPFSSFESVRSLRSRSRSDEGKKSPATNPLVPSDSESELERDGVTFPTAMMFPAECSGSQTKEKVTSRRTVLKTEGKQKNKKSLVSKTYMGALKPDQSQPKLTELIGKSSISGSRSNSDRKSEEQAEAKDPEAEYSDKATDHMKILCETISEEVTSVWDDYSEIGQTIPRKRIIKDVEVPLEGSQTRRRKIPIRKLGTHKASDVEISQRSDSVKKRLELPCEMPGPSKKDDKDDDTDKEVNNFLCGKSHLLALVAEVITPPEHAVSPLPTTPERQRDATPSPETVPSTSKLQNLTEKLKVLSKMNGQALKNRLKQSGKLTAIKDKLVELDNADKEILDVTEEEPLAKTEDSQAASNLLPAYQRFEHLAEEGTPTLTLPFTYKVLERTFQAMDTVVSMMHNRSEMCTFSKLRAAVQNITKKNFEERTVGQVKTVVPNAYIFRQEKNIPTFGKKLSGYQLTVEANLDDEEPAKNNNKQAVDGQPGKLTSEGKPVFTASCLIRRKKCFKNNLLDHVKQQHKAFLASLNPPLSVPEHKLTRWHPRFPLDKVLEIDPSPLPGPPEVKVYHSAKDVLEKQKGRLNPRVEAAFSKIVAEKEDADDKRKKMNSLQSTDSSWPSSSVSSSQTSLSSSQNPSSLKGIPPALLAKIRAKEAQKMEESLTRSPAEDSKTQMMCHLPDIIRILRTYFVTEKKPALPLESVYKKLEDSYHIGLSRRELEQHMDLLRELAPEFISQVEIKRGKFLKVDKNVDVQALSSRILNLVKSRK